MSADNWAKCPRCVKQAEVRLRRSDVNVASSYGMVPVEEFDAKREALRADWAEHGKDDTYRSFREDYEIYGAEDGTVRVSYSGHCEECGLSLEFKHEHELAVDG